MNANKKDIEKYPEWAIDLVLDIKKEIKKQIEENRL